MPFNLRHTKIVCTIGPSCSSPEFIRMLIQAGMDVARLNFSHGDQASHRAAINSIRNISAEEHTEIGILQDLGGPKIRLGDLASQERLLNKGEIIQLSADEKDPSIIPVKYPDLLEDVSIGDRIFLADGRVELKVTARNNDSLSALVVVGGAIQSRKGVYLPSSSLRIPSLTEKDMSDIEMGLGAGVDFIALSFVRHEDDLIPVRKIISRSSHKPMVIAKIETPQAVKRLDAIISSFDGLMVARGDLGVEVSFEEVPIIQKQIIAASRKAGKPVITATQMLGSMVSNPRPTRAEAADVANAILDGTDALMLSDETAAGEYPVESVKVLDRIARAIEPRLKEFSVINQSIAVLAGSTESAMGKAACQLADELESPVIIAATTSGSTARLVTRYRPSCPIIALTPDLLTQRQLTISWGVKPVLVKPFKDADEIFSSAKQWALDNGAVHGPDNLIVTAGVPAGKPGSTNLLRVLKIE